MAKNILVFADGTGNEGGLLPDESRTNVYKLFRATRTGPDSSIDPAKQIAFYVQGIGTPVSGHTSLRARSRYTAEQMFGFGFTSRVIECYLAVISSWQPRDRIYLFGFSRGAYTARCVAHVLDLCGIPTKQPGSDSLSFEPGGLRKVAKAAVRVLYHYGMPTKDDEHRQKSVDQFRTDYGSLVGPLIGATPYFIGVWDSVAAIGWKRFFPKWAYDLHYPRDVAFGRHAMAIDEYRKTFSRVQWGGSGTIRSSGKEDVLEPFEQVWFAGNHADIGGSYPENESRLSDISLGWMADFVAKQLPEETRISIDDRYLKLYPSSEGMMHDECMVGIGGTPAHWYPGDRDVPPEAQLHHTVIERLKLNRVRNFTSYGPYRPAPLRNHREAKPFFQNAADDGRPEAEARTPPSSPDGSSQLP
jgi:uncharacterized protein (DUF2235 family)